MSDVDTAQQNAAEEAAHAAEEADAAAAAVVAVYDSVSYAHFEAE